MVIRENVNLASSMEFLNTVTVMYFSWIISSLSDNLSKSMLLYSSLYGSSPSCFKGIRIFFLNLRISTFRLLMVILVITEESKEFNRSL